MYLDEYLNYGKCTNILAESAGRALGGIISKFKQHSIGYKTYTKMFDTSVVPILNYGSEIWGYGTFTNCDKIFNRAMRYFMGVHRFAPTAAIQGDMGWVSLKYRRYINVLRFWNRLVRMDDSRLVKRIFLESYMEEANNWCTDVYHLAELFDVLDDYRCKNAFDIKAIEDKCVILMMN